MNAKCAAEKNNNNNRGDYQPSLIDYSLVLFVYLNGFVAVHWRNEGKKLISCYLVYTYNNKILLLLCVLFSSRIGRPDQIIDDVSQCELVRN